MVIEMAKPLDTHPQNREGIPDKCDRYHGLRNLGETCYLNSVLQVLFMTEDFREAVESQLFAKSQDNMTVDLQLKRLFETLRRREACTNELISLKLGNGNGDAAEDFVKILSMVNPDVSKIFKGQLRHNATCSAGHMAIDEITPFWTLPVSMEDPTGVDNTYSVRDGFEKFFKPSSISGDKMYCDVCRDKAEATIACEMEHPPEILTLYLKRFKVDYRSTLVKNDCCVDVPHILQTENSEYELYAFVDHVGSLRGGHYTAIIKSYENQKWYLFDDTKVKQLDSQPHNDFTTSRSAYLLMYRKVHAPDTVPFLRTGGQRDNVMMKTGKEDMYYTPAGRLVCPFKWTAPEAIASKKFTIKGDVWSFGILLYEIMTFGEEPYPKMDNIQMAQWVAEGNRMACPPHCPKAMHEIMLDCWKKEKCDRPTFKTLQTKLKILVMSFGASCRVI
ncbi:uncharacterized protein [Salvelinus alpinus]|uniref:uncharacterized protein isoform X2 n=1 Tax=Salvelinus alpinus TaxID=8036 RepID=UPI0039FCD489